MAIIADKAFSVDAAALSVGFSWLGAIAYTFQIYYDFSGYSDMAIGLGKMFGFVFDENFNYPYIAKSATDFWRRWHISLSAWFRDYVYIPLGGDGRNKENKKFLGTRNLFFVWVLTGFWHGAQWTFLLWGIGYFILLAAEKKWILPSTRSKCFENLYRVITIMLIVVLWVVFRANSILQLGYYLKTMFFAAGTNVLDANFLFYLRNYAMVFVLAILGSIPILKTIKSKFRDNSIMKLAYIFLLFLFFVVDVSYLVMGYHNPFIYFNF